MSKIILDQLVASAPPTAIDVEAIMRRERRRRGRHVLGTTGLAVLVSLAVGAAVLVPNAWRPQGGASPVAASPTSHASPSGTQSVFLGAEPTEPRDAAVVRLTEAMREAVRAQAPEMRMSPHFGTTRAPFAAELIVEPKFAGTKFEIPGYYIAGAADIEVGRVTGSVRMSVGRRLPSDRLECPTDPPAHYECVTWTAPTGEQVSEIAYVGTSDREGKGLGWQHYSVAVYRPDGQSVSITVQRGGKGFTMSKPLPEPPLNRRQLVAIVMNPALTLYP
ncbi:hypothetical protein [Catellatospora chokoriensis]|uniref:Uncharacterized protein n=1 Tax=Catellatospora chokoriensis TaxID=310353 RepID=A0A8J3JPQ4_9ACTN|nr:hypothetical protein [Catellatospora chokoriensis]GIF88802.1 hypothetical protein Cch02nite_22460 [Catellatospora chokoriensis]